MSDEAKIVESKVTFRMPQLLHLQLKIVAAQERKSIQEILNGLAQAYVDKKDRERE